MESELDVYPWTGNNDLVQFVTSDRLCLGGGAIVINGGDIGINSNNYPALDPQASDGNTFGLTMDSDFITGLSGPCTTFNNPCLTKVGAKDGMFEIANLEVWTFTPCMNEEEAEKLEFKKMFFEDLMKGNLG